FLENILNGLETMICVTNPKTNEILFINNSMKDHLGIEGNPVGQLCYKVLQSGIDRVCDFCPVPRLADEPDTVVEWDKYGTIKGCVYSSIDRLIDWPGGHKVHLQSSTDITDKRAMETELIAAKEFAEQSSKAKGSFLSNMSHEMRTPLNVIIGMTAIGKNAHNIEQKNHALNKISDASAHLLGVINDVLDMAKIEADKLELSTVEFNIEHMLQRIITVIGFRVDEKHQQLMLNIDDAIPRIIEGDDQRLSQVITNLLTNAVKFTPEEGTINLNVSLINETDGECELRFEVSDSGIGISQEQQLKLFSAFIQAESGTSRQYGGTGLGLAISKRIVEMMDGMIWIESELGKGAAFIFTIKARRGRDMDLDIDKPNAAAVEGEFKGKTMLLAEDVEINREILIALLEDTGITIECAVNGTEALNAIEANPGKFDIIFMDMQMPVMDGLETTRRIRALPGHRRDKLPIIAMTANVFKDDIEACLEAGMDYHVGKPIDLDKVIDVMRKYL
ncbi:MAG: ATP-binding protein, partial [Oscillospiraceae bacterium]|nr:ATP-binding protein [Oscillospiraceae bacterium]